MVTSGVRYADLMLGGGESNPWHRSLVRQVDSDNSTQVMFLDGYPRLPIIKKLWSDHIDEN